jgi:hypothetical protein
MNFNCLKEVFFNRETLYDHMRKSQKIAIIANERNIERNNLNSSLDMILDNTSEKRNNPEKKNVLMSYISLSTLII